MVNEMTEVLTARGAMPLHAAKVEQMFSLSDGSDFCKVRDGICDLPKTHPDGVILGLIGERGVGKTQAAVCGMSYWVKGRIGSVRYIRFAELCMRFRDAIKQGTETLTLREFQGSKRDLLIIDEMDKRADTEHERRTLSTLIDGRYGYGRYTLMIGNDTREGLLEAIGPTIASRMRESGGIRELTGRDYREARR